MNTMKHSTEIFNMLLELSADKKISRELLIEYTEEAFKDLIKSKYSFADKIETRMKRNTGEIVFYMIMKIVNDSNDLLNDFEISLSEAKTIDKTAKIGGEILKKVNLNLSVKDAKFVRDALVNKIESFSNHRQYDVYKNREGELVSCVVRKIDKHPVTGEEILLVSIGNEVDGFITKQELLKTDHYDIGDKFQVVIKKVIKSQYENKIILSRSSSSFVSALFADKIPEVKDGIVEIKAIARNPGFCTKVAVDVSDNYSSIDPVGACIGAKGSRIREILDELKGEKVDVVQWSDDIEEFAKNVFKSVEVMNVDYNSTTGIMTIEIPEEKKSLCIGRSGQNARLFSQLLGCDLNIVSPQERQDFMKNNLNTLVKYFMDSLDIEEDMARLLCTKFSSVEDLVKAGVVGIAKIQFFNEEIAQEIYSRAKFVHDENAKSISKELNSLGFNMEILNMTNFFNLEHALMFAKAGFKDFEDFSVASAEDIVNIFGKDNFSRKYAKQLIDLSKNMLESQDV